MRRPPSLARLLPSVRARLALLIAASFLPVIAMSGLVVWQNFREVAGHATEVVLLARGATAARAGIVLRDAQQTLYALSQSALLAGSGSACGGYLAEVLAMQRQVFGNIEVYDDRGRLACSALRPPDPAASAAAAPWFGEVRSTGGFVLGRNVQTGRVSGMPVIVAAYPLRTDGRFSGAVVAGLRLEDLGASGVTMRDGVTTWLVPPDGDLVPLGPPAVAARPSPTVLARLRGADGSTAIVGSQSGVPYAYASAELSGAYRMLTGYRAARDERRAYALLFRRAGQIAVLALLSLLAVTAGASFAIVRPLRRLGHAVEGWRGSGSFDPGPLHRAPSELRELARSFSDAAASLTERELELRGAVAQQELLMQEIHHRVKNNLQIVASLLNLQASRIRQPEARAEFQSARDRVKALATLHRHLYTHGEVHTINMRSFLVELSDQLFQAMGERAGQRIGREIEAPELQMSSDQAVPLALIVTEAVSNALKYAFPDGRSGHILVRLEADRDSAKLVICDDGVGIPAGRVETETGTRDGIGLQLIRGFARQLGATLVVSEQDGTRYEVLIPLQRERALNEGHAPEPAAAV